MRLRLTATAAIAVFAGLMLPAPARADCQPVGTIEEALQTAQVAFVGTVLVARPGEAGATFRVEERWVGAVGETVEVLGLLGRPLSEDDRTWQLGARYLVIPFVDGTVLRDHICTATTLWREELAALRPPGAAQQVGAPTGGSPPPWPMFAGVLAASIMLVAGVIAFRKRPTG